MDKRYIKALFKFMNVIAEERQVCRRRQIPELLENFGISRCKDNNYFAQKQLSMVDLGWYAQRRRTFTLERDPDFSRRAMLLNEQISEILAAT